MRSTGHTLADLDPADADALGVRSRVREIGAGVAALVVFAMLLGLTVSAVKPALAERARDGSGERLTTRAITWQVTRATQRMTHRQEYKPVASIAWASRALVGCVERTSVAPIELAAEVAGGVRVALLNLPPPVA